METVVTVEREATEVTRATDARRVTEAGGTAAG